MREKKTGARIRTFMNRRRTKTLYFILIFAVFIGGYGFFFTSMWWMPTGGNGTMQTEINEELQWSEGRQIRIIRWEYSEEQKLMEVELVIDNTSFDGVNSYEYAAAERNKGDLEIKTILEEPDWVILRIENVPRKFSDIVVHVIHPESGDYFSVYTNVNAVSRVNRIEAKDRDGYLLARYDNEMEGYQDEIEKLQENIQEARKSINTVTQEKELLETKKEYQTESEKEQTENAVLDADSQIEELNGSITDWQAEINEYQERIRNLEKKKESIQ